MTCKACKRSRNIRKEVKPCNGYDRGDEAKKTQSPTSSGLRPRKHPRRLHEIALMAVCEYVSNSRSNDAGVLEVRPRGGREKGSAPLLALSSLRLLRPLLSAVA